MDLNPLIVIVCDPVRSLPNNLHEHTMGNANLLDAQVVMVPATGVDVTQCCGPKK